MWRKDCRYQWERSGALERVSKNEGEKRQCLLSYFYSLNLANSLTLADVTECGGILSTEAFLKNWHLVLTFQLSISVFFFKETKPECN